MRSTMHEALTLYHLRYYAFTRHLVYYLRLCKRWDDNIKMYLYLRWHGVDWIYVGKNTNKRWTLVSTIMYLQVP